MHANELKVASGSARGGGFTLIEVLAALVIVSLGMLGAIEAVTATANSGAYLRDKTFAHWIAMNRVTEMRLERKTPNVGKSSDEVEMAGRKWRWSMEVTQTQVDSIRRIDVSVALADSPKDSSLAFVSGFYGSAVDQPGVTGGIWPGGDAGGTGPGGAPPDPNNPNNPNNPNAPPGGQSPPKGDPGQAPPPPPPNSPDPGADPGSSPQ